MRENAAEDHREGAQGGIVGQEDVVVEAALVDQEMGSREREVAGAQRQHPPPGHGPVGEQPVVDQTVERGHRNQQRRVLGVMRVVEPVRVGQVADADQQQEPATPDRDPHRVARHVGFDPDEPLQSLAVSQFRWCLNLGPRKFRCAGIGIRARRREPCSGEGMSVIRRHGVKCNARAAPGARSKQSHGPILSCRYSYLSIRYQVRYEVMCLHLQKVLHKSSPQNTPSDLATAVAAD